MKRYVLLENNEIIDRKNDMIWQSYPNVFQKQTKHQSDNILDLLEVGDMVEHLNSALKEIKNNEQLTWVKMLDKNEISAIWKRSGDIMRRYEV